TIPYDPQTATTGRGFVNGVQSLHPPTSAGLSPSTISHAQRILVLVGPEGGWTDDERSAAQNARFQTLTLNPYVLRVETAALAAAAVFRQIHF
ncbi:MAG: RsmE family RNA methyltransferase, partial [Phycisphaeraceae bacterium]